MPKKQVMIIDFKRCIRIAPGDEKFLEPMVPYRCTDCERWGEYQGKLLMKGDEVPFCKEHRRPFRPVLAGSHVTAKPGIMKPRAA